VTHVRTLGEKCGPILFQLPASFRCSPERLADLLALLPRGQRFTIQGS